MKKVLIAFLSAMLVGLALNVQAANVNFTPGLIRFQVAPGQADKAYLRVIATSGEGFSLTIMMGSKVNGNLPASWFHQAMTNLRFAPDGTASSPMEIGINVPPNALAGTYRGALMPEAVRSSEPLFSRGVMVVIEVLPQSSCSTLPVFENVEIGPQEIWAPSDRDVDIYISGSVKVDSNCDISNVTASYSFEDNLGTSTGSLVLDEQGNFARDISVNVSRSGKDKDGRIYNGMLLAEDGDGNSTGLDFFVTVAHDQGQKKGHSK
jgi:hypothetical protein